MLVMNIKYMILVISYYLWAQRVSKVDFETTKLKMSIMTIIDLNFYLFSMQL